MDQRVTRQNGGDLLKGLAAGAVGGGVASAVMNQFQKICGRVLLGDVRSHGAQSLQQGAPDHGVGKMLQERGIENADDDSAERLAQTISVGLFDHELGEADKSKAGTAFHY